MWRKKEKSNDNSFVGVGGWGIYIAKEHYSLSSGIVCIVMFVYYTMAMGTKGDKVICVVVSSISATENVVDL